MLTAPSRAGLALRLLLLSLLTCAWFGPPAQAAPIDVGGEQACAIDSDERVRCWGDGDDGLLGGGSSDIAYRPITVIGLTGATSVATSENHSCARLRSGEAWCWGNGYYGALGYGGNGVAYAPKQVTGLPAAVVDVAIGASHSCAVLVDGTAWCWGYNGEGQLGDGTKDNRLVPVMVAGVSSAVGVAAGDDHSCVLLADRTRGAGGAAVTVPLATVARPTNSHPLRWWASPTSRASRPAGGSHTCAWKTDGSAYCWGSG